MFGRDDRLLLLATKSDQQKLERCSNPRQYQRGLSIRLGQDVGQKPARHGSIAGTLLPVIAHPQLLSFNDD